MRRSAPRFALGFEAGWGVGRAVDVRLIKSDDARAKMRTAWLSPFALALACTATPSAVPLGGVEWVGPKRHIDKRPRAKQAKSTQSPTRARDSPQSRKAPTRSRSSPELGTSGPVHFGFRPLAQNSVVLLDTRFSVKAKVSLSLDGKETIQDASFESKHKFAVRILEADPELVRAVEVHYEVWDSLFRMTDMEEERESHAGERYQVAFGGGTPQVTSESGTPDPDQRAAVLFDLVTVTGYPSIVRGHLPRTLAVGSSHQLGPSVLSVLTREIPDLGLEGARLTFLGPDRQKPDRALFECGAMIRLERDGVTLGGELSGTCSVRADDLRVDAIHIQGRIQGTDTQALGDGSQITGSAEFRIQQSYRP